MHLYIVLMMIYFGGHVTSQNKNGDVSIRCERFTDGPNFNVRCNFTDNRKSDPHCPSQSVLPHFQKISVACAFSPFFPFRKAECKVVESKNNGQKKESENLLSANGTLFLNSVEHDSFVWDGLVNFESILSNALSIGEALVRCKAVSPPESDRLICSLFGVGNKASATGNFSCSLTSSSMSTFFSVNIIQCGFTEDQLTAKYRGNLTIFVKSYENVLISADVLFVAQSNFPANFIMETVRLNCHVISETEILVCEAHLNEGKFCENPHLQCDEQKEEGGAGAQQTTLRERDVLWDLDRTIEYNIEEGGVVRATFTCQQAIDVNGYITKCSYQISDKNFSVDRKAIIDFTWNENEFFFNNVELVQLNMSNKHCIYDIFVQRCELQRNQNDSILFCRVQVEKRLKGELQCDVKEAKTENEAVNYRLSCKLDFLDGYAFEGIFVYSSDPDAIRIRLEGELKAIGGEDSLYPFSLSCDISGDDPMKVYCLYDGGGSDKLCQLFRY